MNNVREVPIRYEIKVTGSERGLVATESISQGMVIALLPLVIQNHPDRYSIETSLGVHADCSSSPVGVINHSCNPNAAVRKGRIVSWSCIQPGDPITIDYKRTEQKLAEPFDCRCGSKNCRGRIE